MLRKKETSKLTVCESMRFGPLKALEGFGITSKIRASSMVMEQLVGMASAGECASVVNWLCRSPDGGFVYRSLRQNLVACWVFFFLQEAACYESVSGD